MRNKTFDIRLDQLVQLAVNVQTVS